MLRCIELGTVTAKAGRRGMESWRMYSEANLELENKAGEESFGSNDRPAAVLSCAAIAIVVRGLPWIDRRQVRCAPFPTLGCD